MTSDLSAYFKDSKHWRAVTGIQIDQARFAKSVWKNKALVNESNAVSYLVLPEYILVWQWQIKIINEMISLTRNFFLFMSLKTRWRFFRYNNTPNLLRVTVKNWVPLTNFKNNLCISQWNTSVSRVLQDTKAQQRLQMKMERKLGHIKNLTRLVDQFWNLTSDM